MTPAQALQLMGVQTYQLRSALLQAQAESTIDELAEPEANQDVSQPHHAASEAVGAKLIQQMLDAPAPAQTKESPAKPDAAPNQQPTGVADRSCDYFWASAGNLVIFTLSENGLSQAEQQLFASISKALCRGDVRQGKDSWQPLASKSSNRKRTLRMFVSSLVEPDQQAPVLLLLGSQCAALWSDEQWDLVQGSRQPAEAPFGGLRFGPSLDEMFDRPYLKSQLWQLTRDLASV